MKSTRHNQVIATVPDDKLIGLTNPLHSDIIIAIIDTNNKNHFCQNKQLKNIQKIKIKLKQLSEFASKNTKRKIKKLTEKHLLEQTRIKINHI
jgi:hypothetical protein